LKSLILFVLLAALICFFLYLFYFLILKIFIGAAVEPCPSQIHTTCGLFSVVSVLSIGLSRISVSNKWDPYKLRDIIVYQILGIDEDYRITAIGAINLWDPISYIITSKVCNC